MRGKVRGTATKGSLATGGQTSSAPEWLLKRFQRSAKQHPQLWPRSGKPPSMEVLWQSLLGDLKGIAVNADQSALCSETNAGSVREINRKKHMNQFHPCRRIERKPSQDQTPSFAPGCLVTAVCSLMDQLRTAWCNSTVRTERFSTSSTSGCTEPSRHTRAAHTNQTTLCVN